MWGTCPGGPGAGSERRRSLRVCHSVASWHQDRVDDKEGQAQPDAEGRHRWRRRDEVIELCVIMCGY